jgi:tetratricopeptide (TPR) repeat protein
MYKILVSVSILILSGCVTVSPQQQLNYEANLALDREDYEVARQRYEASLNSAQLNNDKQYEAIAMYGLGRSYGYLCKYEESEKWFLKSIKLREEIPNTSIAYLTQNILELARLYKAAGKYKKANEQFERAIPLLENLAIEFNDPIGYAATLEDYVVTLKETGNSSEASQIMNLIKNLRDKYPNLKPGFVAKQYPVSCKK